MRRHNCWAAILAIGTILPILSSGLAREQLPSNYQDGELQTNDSKAAYQASQANLPSRNARANDDSVLKLQGEASKLTGDTLEKLQVSDFPEADERSASKLSGNEDRTETTGPTPPNRSRSGSNVKHANFPDEQPYAGIFPKANGDGASREESTIGSDPSNTVSGERSNKSGAGEQRRKAGERSSKESFRGIRKSTVSSIEISGEKRLSQWISRAVIKNFPRRRNDVIHRAETHGRTSLQSRKSETASAKEANQWGEYRESFTVDHIGENDAVGRLDKFADIEESYKQTGETFDEHDAPSDSVRIETEKRDTMDRTRGSNFTENRPDSRADERNVDENVRLPTVEKLFSHQRSIVNKLMGHGSTNSRRRSPMLPVPVAICSNSSETGSEVSTVDEKIRKTSSTVETHFVQEAEQKTVQSSVIFQQGISEVQTETKNRNELASKQAVHSRQFPTAADGEANAKSKENGYDKSVYNFINNRYNATGTLSSENAKGVNDSIRSKFKRTDEGSKRIKLRSEFQGKPDNTIDSGNPTSPVSHFKIFDRSSKQVKDHGKGHVAHSEDHFEGIEDSEHGSPSHKSAEVQLAEGTYKLGESRSKQRSRVNIDRPNDNSERSVLSAIPGGDPGTFSASTTAIGTHSTHGELHFVGHPPLAWKKENSIVSGDTSAVTLNSDGRYEPEKTRENPHPVLPSLNTARNDTDAAVSRGQIASNEKSATNKIGVLTGQKTFHSVERDITKSSLVGGEAITKKNYTEENRKSGRNETLEREESFIKSEKVDNYSETGPINELRMNAKNFTDKNKPNDEKIIVSGVGVTEKPKNVSEDCPRGSIMAERNVTYLNRDMNSPVMSTEGRIASVSDGRAPSRIGFWNAPDPFRNSELPSSEDSGAQRRAKNPRMEPVKAVAVKLKQLSESKDSTRSESREVSLGNHLRRMNERKPEENRETYNKATTSTSLKIEADGRKLAEQEFPRLLDKSISLTKPSNVIDGQGSRDVENYADKSSATKFSGRLNGSPRNVPIIASKAPNGIPAARSPDSLNQNKPHERRTSSTDETGDNESASGFTSGNAKTKGVEDPGRGERNRGISDNGPANEVNPREDRKTKDIRDPHNRQTKKKLALELSQTIGETGDSFFKEYLNSRKERKSRSSMKKVPSIPLSQIRHSTSPPPQDLLAAPAASTKPIQTSDSRYDQEPGVTSLKIDSAPQTLENDTSETATGSSEQTPDRRMEFETSSGDRSNITSETDKAQRESLPTKETSLLSIVKNPHTKATSVDLTFEPNEDQLLGYAKSREMQKAAVLRTTGNSSSELEPPDLWPVKHSAVVEGDLVLGGLMMVHEREDTITCGPVMPQGGVQALEAMLYTLDKLNDRGIVPGIKIGAHILDDCDKDTYGLEMAVDFIKGSISNIDGAEYHCNKTAVRKVISGVVGAASSVTSIQVANLLRLFRIPQVSFFSTSPELSNKQRFEYFTRTIPSDHYQVKAMVNIVLKMGWKYVSIIYEESNYGIKAFEELEDLLGKHNICIAIKEKLVKDSGVAEETAYDNIVLKLLTKPRARGCIIFGSDQEVAGVMRAVRRCNATGAFSWIGSDGWSARGLVSNGNEPEVEGTLSVQPQANPVEGFEEYFLNLTVENNRRNPWFVEFWEDHFQCRYPNASRTPYNQKYTNSCTTEEHLTKQNTAFEDQLQFVSDAVTAFAYAFRDMHADLCHGKPGLCDAMKPTKGMELLKYLRKVDFEGLTGDRFRFDKNGDGPARYNIIHFKQTEPGTYKWIRVGEYLEGELRLNMSEIQFKRGQREPPESVCSLPCEVGQAKKYVEGEKCCWHCFNCTQYQIRHPKDETQCIPCRQGTVPDETHSTCRDIPEEFLRPESGWAIGAMSFSATGILITMCVCGVFLKHNDTPVVRASGRELSYVLLSGILLCYLVTFALVLRPTDIVCGIQRFAAGFCFTVVYAALLTKTNRISRIFNAGKHSAKRPSFISPRSQLIICSGLVFVQILINGVWIVIDPARAMHHYPTREDNLLVCNSYIDASYMIAFAYPIMLIVVCTVYAVLTRKIPEAFNESKHIGFTMYTTCVIWLAFVPLYFGTGSNVALRITSMSVTISLSASVTIACLFSPKLYIILIRPERNVRQSMMPVRYSTTKSSAVTATNASSMMAPITLTAATCDQNKTVKKHITTTIDSSTQIEYYELQVKDQKNGKPPPAVVSRSTQTSSGEKDGNAVATGNKDAKESTTATKQLNNNARIGNGPVNQSDVPL